MINDDYDDGDDDHDSHADLGKPSAPIVLWGQSISALSSTSSNFLNLEPLTTLMKCIEMYCTLVHSDLMCFRHNLPISTTACPRPQILQYHNINFTFASGGIWSSSRSLSIIGEKVHFTYTFYWWKKSVSLSLSIGKKWPTQLHSLSLMVKYDPPHFHFLWVKYGPDNYFYFHQRWNMNSLQHCPWFPQSLVAGTM